MPLKNTKQKKLRGSSKKKTGVFGRLKLSRKMVLVVSLIVFAAVGGLLVRFSQAATGYSWGPSSMQIVRGKYVIKSDGRPAAQSELRIDGSESLVVNVASSVSNSDTYCFGGKALKGLINYRITYYYEGRSTSAVTVASGGSVNPGDFLLCGRVPGRSSATYPGVTRRIQLEASSSAAFAVFKAARQGY